MNVYYYKYDKLANEIEKTILEVKETEKQYKILNRSFEHSFFMKKDVGIVVKSYIGYYVFLLDNDNEKAKKLIKNYIFDEALETQKKANDLFNLIERVRRCEV